MVSLSLDREDRCWAFRPPVLRVHEDVVKVAEHEAEFLGDLVDEPLESLAGVAKAKPHEGELEEAERCDDGRLGYVRLVYR